MKHLGKSNKNFDKPSIKILDKHNKENGKIPFVTASARDLLLNHDWPGNVRELENTLQRALVLSGSLS